MHCPDENQLAAFLEARLDVESRTGVDVHLDQCTACRSLVSVLAEALGTPLPQGPSDPNRELFAGDRIADRYVLLKHVGEGGTSTVWAARDETDGSEIALKILKERVSEGQKRLAREARVTAALDHPNILQSRCVVTDGEAMFLVMDLLAGESLASRLVREPLTLSEVGAFTLPAIEALSFAHDAGVLHRDIKPENIFLCEDRRVLLLDFGLAKLLERVLGLTMTSTTQAGFVLGTPQYMAPEQLAADPNVGPPADVWSLGVVLYECLGGKRPIDGRSFGQIFKQIYSHNIMPLREIAPKAPRELTDCIDRMLTLDAPARPTLEDVRRCVSTFAR